MIIILQSLLSLLLLSFPFICNSCPFQFFPFVLGIAVLHYPPLPPFWIDKGFLSRTTALFPSVSPPKVFRCSPVSLEPANEPISYTSLWLEVIIFGMFGRSKPDATLSCGDKRGAREGYINICSPLRGRQLILCVRRARSNICPLKVSLGAMLQFWGLESEVHLFFCLCPRVHLTLLIRNRTTKEEIRSKQTEASPNKKWLCLYRTIKS